MDSNDHGLRYLLKVYSIEVSTLSGNKIKPGSKIDVAIDPEADSDTLVLATKMCRDCSFASLPPKGTNQGKPFFSRDVPMWRTLAFGLTCFVVGATFWKAPSTKTIESIKKIASAVGEIAAEINKMTA